MTEPQRYKRKQNEEVLAAQWDPNSPPVIKGTPLRVIYGFPTDPSPYKVLDRYGYAAYLYDGNYLVWPTDLSDNDIHVSRVMKARDFEADFEPVYDDPGQRESEVQSATAPDRTPMTVEWLLEQGWEDVTSVYDSNHGQTKVQTPDGLLIFKRYANGTCRLTMEVSPWVSTDVPKRAHLSLMTALSALEEGENTL